MTMSIAARCARTGMVGVTVSSSSICVAARCAFVRSGAGAALSQNITDPSLGERGLDLLEQGRPAEQALGTLVDSAPHAAWRQLALVDTDGGVAHFSGERTLGRHAAAEGHDCVAIGNLLASRGVPSAMVRGFEASEGHLASRLLAALEAGLAAGGEEGPVRSAGLLVAHEVSWPIVDLRVDWDTDPIPQLGVLWREYEPQLESYVTRALDPSEAPSYGVPGDP